MLILSSWPLVPGPYLMIGLAGVIFGNAAAPVLAALVN